MLGANIIALALWLFQEEAMQFDPISMWRSMGWSARTVVILLFIMSAWSIGVMIDRWIAYQSARKQSRIFAPAVAGALRRPLRHGGGNHPRVPGHRGPEVAGHRRGLGGNRGSAGDHRHRTVRCRTGRLGL